MANEKWLTDLSVDDLKAKILPEPCEPFKVDGEILYKNRNLELLPNEIFKQHPKWPVEVSNMGRIKFNNIILEQKPDYSEKYPEGYLWLEIPDVTKYQRVYRLVAETWCERPDSQIYNTVHHISNNGTDNRVENLLWVTKEQHAEIHLWLKNGPIQ
jgi:hypothetical protein